MASLYSIRTKTSLLFLLLFIIIILPVNWIIYRNTCHVLMEASQREMEGQARQILALGPHSVLIKGGHGRGAKSPDYLLTEAGGYRLQP